MPSGVNDLPLHMRGTLNIGGTDYHFRRSIKNGVIYPHKGKDTRDWAMIDAGAIDYADIAAMEHSRYEGEEFPGHDGPRITAACPVCNGSEAAVPTGRDRDTEAGRIAADRALAAQGNEAARQRLASRGLLGQQPDGDTLVMPATISPARQAELDQAAAARAEQEERERIQALADQADKEALRQQGAEEQIVVDPGGEAAATALPEGMGVDPWTKEVVKITRNPGADAEAPYGRKKDGEPRRPGGLNKAHGRADS